MRHYARPRPVIQPLDTRNEFEKAVDKMISEIPTQLKLITAQAELAKQQYDSLINVGFTEQQAIQLMSEQPSWK